MPSDPDGSTAALNRVGPEADHCHTPFATVGPVLFPSVCAVCGTPGPTPCRACAGRLRPAGLIICPAGLDGCASLLEYGGAGRDLVLALKYRNHRAVVRPLGRAMAGLIEGPVDVVTWVPTTAARRRERGYDQARLLAREIGRTLGRPCRGLLRRAPGSAQTGRSLAERQQGPVLTARRPVRGTVLLVDDVLTTGASLAAAAATLRGAGAHGVEGVTAAVTPLKVGRTTAENWVIDSSRTEWGSRACR